MFLRQFILSLLLLSPSLVAAREVGASHLSDFSQVIRMNAFSCSSANKGAHIDNSERGMEFIIACDDDLYLYFVQVRNDGSFCVEPYGERGQKCK
jgi:hypothetical protein